MIISFKDEDNSDSADFPTRITIHHFLTAAEFSYVSRILDPSARDSASQRLTFWGSGRSCVTDTEAEKRRRYVLRYDQDLPSSVI